MVLFGIKIVTAKAEDSGFQGQHYRLPTSQNSTNYNDLSYIPTFVPDISNVVTFGTAKHDSRGRLMSGHQKHGMRLKTQLLIMQNYEKVKQAMLVGKDTNRAIYVAKFADKATPTSRQGPSMMSFMNNLKSNVAKKRTFNEVPGAKVGGRFRFKFQEGHSKNFKREVGFDFFE